LTALQEAILPVRLSALYKIGLLLVAVIMILLPLIYIAMMAGVGYGVYFHAVRHAGIISNIWTVKNHQAMKTRIKNADRILKNSVCVFNPVDAVRVIDRLS
jgi:hypothetical protein